ncbi:MAG TPA: type II secretion system protein [Verrucomicrobiota bacterium]|jgi:general secretion pathway protein J|nr:type II secretion system protein [Verrucomicrobiota bacterium]HRT07998.1 type II secretion system protein [Candidatus Paceibacterota bacterium]HRT55465.1 type II secretion system protein [Candidatus Paceibacterota bacterium]
MKRHVPIPSRGLRAFTLVEILISIGILGLVLVAIYSSWTAILRASKVGLDAAAAVQRARIAMHTIEDALLCIQSFAANQPYYGFYAEKGREATLSFVARLPQSFPRSGKFGELDVRRVTFSLEPGEGYSEQLVLRQAPLLTEWDVDEKEHPLVLAKHVREFSLEFWDSRKNDWVDEWKETQTNMIPRLVRISMRIADKPNARPEQDTVVARVVSIPSVSVLPAWQAPIARPGVPGAPGAPGVPGPGGVPPGGVPPGSLTPGPGPGMPPGGGRGRL